MGDARTIVYVAGMTNVCPNVSLFAFGVCIWGSLAGYCPGFDIRL